MSDEMEQDDSINHTVIVIKHPALSSFDRHILGEFLKRVKGIAKLKGHFFFAYIPAYGFTHFDGNNFTNAASVGLKVTHWRDHNRIVTRLKTIPDITIAVYPYSMWVKGSMIEMMVN
jgi:hypothetical protein